MKGPLSLHGCPSNCLTKMASDINIVNTILAFCCTWEKAACFVLTSAKAQRKAFALLLSFISSIFISGPVLHSTADKPREASKSSNVGLPFTTPSQILAILHEIFFSLTQCIKEKTEAAPPSFWSDGTVINRLRVAWIINDLPLLMEDGRDWPGKEEETIASTHNHD